MKKPVEQWFAEKGTSKHMPVQSVRLAWAEQGRAWPIGFEVTEYEYDAAVRHVLTTPIGYRSDGVKTGGTHDRT